MFALGNLIFQHYGLSLVIQEKSEMYLAQFPNLGFGHLQGLLEKHENLTNASGGSVTLVAHQRLLSEQPGGAE